MIAATLHRQGHDLAAVTRTGLDPGPVLGLPEVTRREVAAGLVLVRTLSRGALAASLPLPREGVGSVMSVVTLIAGLGAALPRMDELGPLPRTKTGVLQLKRCTLAVPPLPGETAMKTD